MSIHPLKRPLLALPPYAGGKRKLIPWILTRLAKYLPLQARHNLTYVEPFMGGGSMALYAKALGFKQLKLNDCSGRSEIVANALLLNQQIQLSHADLLFLNQSLPEDQSPGLVENDYAPSVFSTRHAKALDQWLFWANKLQSPTKQAMAKLVIWHTINQFVCIPTSINTSNRPYAEALDGVRGWDDINPKRFYDKSLESLLKPTFYCLESKAKAVNKGIFGGTPGTFFRQDAVDFIQSVEEDLLYLDPPYPGTVSYEYYFQVVDHLLCGQKMEEISAFSKSADMLEPLLSKAHHIPIWVLSYGNKHINLNELVALVKRHAGSREVIGFSKSYKHLAHVSKNKENQELLVIAIPKGGISHNAN